MKKFVFTLQSVLGFKQTTEKRQKADLAAVQAVLQQLYAQDRLLDEQFDRTAQSLERVMAERLNIAEELPRHDAFFLHLREEKKVLKKRIEAALEAKRRCQKALIKTMNEIKTLENLKEEQLEQYKEEVRAEEAKDMADLVSYQTITGQE